MRIELVVAILVIATAIGGIILRGLVRRIRRLRRLDRAQTGVEKAVADGRLAVSTGEALKQHLDGLRRACVRGGGS